MFDDLTDDELKLWIQNSLKEGSHKLASGYQGQTLKYESPEHSLVIKVPHGKSWLKKFNVSMLKHEFRVYQKLSELKCIPKCYGLIDQQYLVLQYIDAHPIRSARPINEQVYFSKLFEFIEQMHSMGVGHFDLKKKDNLLVVGEDTPCIIDFGAAVINKAGFHPFKHYWFKLAMRFDYNAWIKHKYNNCLENISENDRPYYEKTLIEIIAQKVKRFYKNYIYDKRK